MNLLFPVSVTTATIVTAWLAHLMLAAEPGSGASASAALLTTLMALAVIEHWFLVLPIPFQRLWDWGLASRAPDDGGAPHAAAMAPDVVLPTPVSHKRDCSAHLPHCVDAQALQMLGESIALGGHPGILGLAGRVNLTGGRALTFAATAGENGLASWNESLVAKGLPSQSGSMLEIECLPGQDLSHVLAALADCEAAPREMARAAPDGTAIGDPSHRAAAA